MKLPAIDWLKAPRFEDDRRTERAALLHLFTLVVMAAGLLYLFLQIDGTYFTLGPAGLATTTVVVMVPVLAQLLMRRGFVTAAAIFFIAFLWGSTTVRFLLTDGVRSSLLYNYANLVIFSGLMLGRRWIWVMFAFCLLPMALHLAMAIGGVDFPPYFHDSRESALVEHVISAAISAFLFWYALGRIEKNISAVRDGESRSRALISAIPDIIFLNHVDGTFLDVKRHESSSLFMEPAKFLGKKPHQVLPSALADRFMNAFATALSDRTEQIVEYHLPMPGGERFYEARIVACTDDTVMTVARDITRRKRAEDLQRASEQQFRTLFEDAPIGIGVIDQTGSLLAFNEAMLAPGGHSREEVQRMGKVAWLFFDDEERLRTLAAFQKHGVLRGANVRFRRKDGTPYGILLSLSHTTFDGQPAIQAIVEDMTEFRRGEGLREAVFRIAEASTSAPDLDQLYRSMHEIIGSVMPAQNFYIAVYDERQDLLSFPYFVDERDEPSSPHRPGKGLTEYVLRTGRSLLCDLAISSDLQRRGEADLVGVDAPIWLGVPLIVERKTIGVMAVQHYSDARAYGEREQRMLEYVSSQVARAIEHKQSETHIRELNADLERRVRERTAALTAVNQELESFVYTISHDLRAPLRGVGGFAALLQRDHSGALSAEAQGYVQRIADGTRRMGALIDDLLAFAHISRKDVHREMVKTDEVVRQVVEELQPAIRTAKTEVLVGHLPQVSADPALLRQVFSNLIANAVKYSSKMPTPRVTVAAVQKDGATTFIVSDNGVGFDMKYAHKLFGVFQRLHAIDEFEGTGVGLAIVHRIVTRHGGSISVDAAEGKGATFSFTVENDNATPPGAA